MKRKKIVTIFLLSVFFTVGMSVAQEDRRGILGQLFGGFREEAGEEVGKIAADVEEEVLRTGGLISDIARGVKQIGVGLKERAKRAYRVVTGLGIAFLKIFLRVNVRGWFFFYQQRYFRFKVDIKIDRRQEFEVEYDLGFSGGGTWMEGFKAVRAKILSTETLDAGGVDVSPDALVFFNNAERTVEKWRQQYILVPFASLALRGVKEVVAKVKNMMRLKPETVFLIKIYSLIRSSMEPLDPINFFDATLQFPLLLSRLAFSVNEAATIKKNNGERNPKKWKVILTFADTGILAIFKLGPLIVIEEFLKTIDVRVRERFLTEWKERKGQKGLTKLEQAYSMMRRTKGYAKQTAYFMEEVLPLLDKVRLDKTDQELFVKAIRVHATRRYQGLLKEMHVFGFQVAEAVDESAEAAKAAAAGRMSTELENELAIAKAVVVYRGLIPAAKRELDKGLLMLVNKSLEKMKSNQGGNKFSRTFRNVVGAIAAQLRDEGKRLKKFAEQVEWPARLAEGQTLDSIGQDEDALSFAKDFRIPRAQDYPFGLPPKVAKFFQAEAIAVRDVVEDTSVAEEEMFGGEGIF